MMKLFADRSFRLRVPLLRAGFCLTLCIIFLAAFSASAQRPRPDFNRPQTFDVQHYTLRVSFERARKRVQGETTVTLKPLKGAFRTVELDAVGLNFESVKLAQSGFDVKYATVGDKVVVTLDREYRPEETIAITFKYTATPKKGIYFVDAGGSAPRNAHSAQIWTQGEPDEARHWFPSFDFPSDKATTEQFITAESGETVVGNGELVDKTENINGTATWHYKMSVPYSTYLVSFVIGKYIKVEDKYKSIPLGFYVYPGKEQLARAAFRDTSKMMGVFEERTGIPYPYNKYDQTIVAKFQFGGMENITATTMADTEIFYEEMGLGGLVTDLVSHELAHSWFGNLVTCRNWAELWLNEGFATYMEAVFRENVGGREAYKLKVRTDAAQFLVHDVVASKDHGLYNLRANNVDALFDTPEVTYQKGGAVLHMLREQVGTDAFWRAVNTYLNRHKFGSVESTDLRRAMEEASGQDLGWFFEQWVYGTGSPNLTVARSYSARSKTLTLTVTQTQGPEALTPPAFRLPMDVQIVTPAGKNVQKLDVTRRTQVFTYRLDGPPSDVIIDPEDKIILKRVKLRPMAQVK
jgi:aminopeptidase N